MCTQRKGIRDAGPSEYLRPGVPGHPTYSRYIHTSASLSVEGRPRTNTNWNRSSMTCSGANDGDGWSLFARRFAPSPVALFVSMGGGRCPAPRVTGPASPRAARPLVSRPRRFTPAENERVRSCPRTGVVQRFMVLGQLLSGLAIPRRRVTPSPPPSGRPAGRRRRPRPCPTNTSAGRPRQ